MKPKILLAILAKQQAPLLPLYLRCIEHQSYPKDRIHLWVRTNNNTDDTAEILKFWLERVGWQYAGVTFDDTDAPQPVQDYSKHDWAPERFSVLNPIRQASLNATLEHGCDAYFVVDCDNFLLPHTLATLIDRHTDEVHGQLNHITAPMLNCCDPDRPHYSNFHGDIDERGWYRESKLYWDLLGRQIWGELVPVVHCTYLVPAWAIPLLRYENPGGYDGRYDYVVFSESARESGVGQWLDSSRPFGCLTFKDGPEAAIRWRKEMGF